MCRPKIGVLVMHKFSGLHRSQQHYVAVGREVQFRPDGS